VSIHTNAYLAQLVCDCGKLIHQTRGPDPVTALRKMHEHCFVRQGQGKKGTWTHTMRSRWMQDEQRWHTTPRAGHTVGVQVLAIRVCRKCGYRTPRLPSPEAWARLKSHDCDTHRRTLEVYRELVG